MTDVFDAVDLPSIAVREPRVVMTFGREGLTRLIVADFRRGIKTMIETETSHNVSETVFMRRRVNISLQNAPETIITHDGKVFLCGSQATAAEIHVWILPFDMSDSTPDVQTIRPDYTFNARYHEGSEYINNTQWSTFIRHPSYNWPRFTLGSSSKYQITGQSQSFDMTSVEWLDVNEVLRALQASGSDTKLPLRRRNVHRFEVVPVPADDEGDPMCCTGSHGFVSCWMEQDETGEFQLRLIPLLDSGLEPELGWDRSDCWHSLHLPIKLSCISRLLLFRDEAATLFLLTPACDNGCCPRSIRAFEY